MGDWAMPEERRSTSADRELAARIVAAYLRHNPLGAEQIGTLIATVHQALGSLGNAAEAAIERTPAVPVKRSVHRDYVICLECGQRGRMLRRHLATHDLTVEEYRARWKLPPEHPMVAPTYREKRSQLAKQLGLGRRAAAAPDLAGGC
jgi:predicted transcriptional regulator